MTDYNASSEKPTPSPPRRPYATPSLTDLGDLRDITLGASPGIGDSGGTIPQRCPGCP